MNIILHKCVRQRCDTHLFVHVSKSMLLPGNLNLIKLFNSNEYFIRNNKLSYVRTVIPTNIQLSGLTVRIVSLWLCLQFGQS